MIKINVNKNKTMEKPKQNLNKKTFQSSNLPAEQLAKALRKKKECDVKAHAVVESLINAEHDETIFLSQLQYINQSHYEDIVEERFIVKLCGYPLCDHILTQIPSKKYNISTTTNKVFDITERKKFCSNFCFKASEYIKSQIHSGPVWMRDKEIATEFKLLDVEKQV